MPLMAWPLQLSTKINLIPGYAPGAQFAGSPCGTSFQNAPDALSFIVLWMTYWPYATKVSHPQDQLCGEVPREFWVTG